MLGLNRKMLVELLFGNSGAVGEVEDVTIASFQVFLEGKKNKANFRAGGL